MSCSTCRKSWSIDLMSLVKRPMALAPRVRGCAKDDGLTPNQNSGSSAGYPTIRMSDATRNSAFVETLGFRPQVYVLMATDEILRALLMYFVLPVWLAA